jgi:hypothetical protein
LPHGTVERGLLTACEIAREFGLEVRRPAGALPASGPSAPWRERKSAAVERPRAVAREVPALACAGNFDNLFSIRDDPIRIGPTAWSRLLRTGGGAASAQRFPSIPDAMESPVRKARTH